MLSQAGDYAGASKVLDHGPQNADTYALRVALAAQNGNGTGLAALYQQLQKAPPEVRAKSAYLLGQLAEAQHLNDEALAWYSQVDDDDTHAFDADLRSAVILQSQGKSNEAHQALEQMQVDYLDQPTQLRKAYQVDAELYMRERKYPQAIAHSVTPCRWCRTIRTCSTAAGWHTPRRTMSIWRSRIFTAF